VSDAYPTVTTLTADLVLPAAMWVEKEGRVRQRRAAHAVLASDGRRAGRCALRPVASSMEFSKRFKIEEVWPAELIAKKPESAARRCTTCCIATATSTSSRCRRWTRLRERRVEGVRLLPAEGAVRGVRDVRPRPRPRPRAVRHVPRGARPALARRRRQGDALALPRGQRPYVKAARASSSTAIPTAAP
jgi:nitrate reductase NapA